jgi:hypothetical protein
MYVPSQLFFKYRQRLLEQIHSSPAI